MSKKNKINLAVIFYGDKKQLAVNNQQFMGLKKLLNSFNLLKYDLNSGQRSKLLNDFRDNKIDIVLKNSYGRGNENDVEKLLEKNKIPFMGSASKETMIGTSKYLSKQVFKKYKLRVAQDLHINKVKWKKVKKNILKKIEKSIKYPCVVKDTGGTDSRGLYLVKNEVKCIKAINTILNKNHDLIVEKFIEVDSEVTCMVVGNNKPIAYEPVGMAANDVGGLFSGTKKDKMAFSVEVPTLLSKNLINKVKKLSVKAHQVLKCKTFSRADILIKDNKLYLLEVDVHPGFRTNSATFLSAKYQKVTPDKLFLKFYKLAISI